MYDQTIKICDVTHGHKPHLWHNCNTFFNSFPPLERDVDSFMEAPYLSTMESVARLTTVRGARGSFVTTLFHIKDE